MSERPRISIVLPAYNEQTRLPATLVAWAAHLTNASYSWEIIVSDDGSSDATVEIARNVAAREPRISVVVAPHNQGKGSAVRRGILAATGETVLFADADLGVPPPFVDAAMAAIDEGADVAAGQRSLREYSRNERSITRVLAGAAVQVTRRILGLTFVRDTQCGFKAFRREMAHRIFEQTTINGFAFDIEVLFLARRLGARITPFPVQVDYREGSTFNVAAHLPAFLRDIVRVRLNALRGVYRIGINP